MGRPGGCGKRKLAARAGPPRPKSRDRDPCPSYPAFLAAPSPAIMSADGADRNRAQLGEMPCREPIGRIVLGFVAAAIAVARRAREHHLCAGNGGIHPPNRAWSMTPAIPPWGVPRLINNIFWGGLWGVAVRPALRPDSRRHELAQGARLRPVHRRRQQLDPAAADQGSDFRPGQPGPVQRLGPPAHARSRSPSSAASASGSASSTA